MIGLIGAPPVASDIRVTLRHRDEAVRAERGPVRRARSCSGKPVPQSPRRLTTADEYHSCCEIETGLECVHSSSRMNAVRIVYERCHVQSLRATREDAFKIQPEDGVTIFEYPRVSPGLGLAYFEVSGRRPSKAGTAYHEVACTFSLYVLEGSGKMTVEGSEWELSPHVVVSVLPGNRWSLTGDLKYIVATMPGFYPDQASEVAE